MEMGDDNPLSPGEHIYPFCFRLPYNLPSSFEGKAGYVRYTIRGIIDRPGEVDYITKRAFTVIAPLDLNTQPNAEVGEIKQNR
jgi:hypothetical protein